MDNAQSEPPRPRRSLRDREDARNISANPDLLPTDYIKVEKNQPVKPDDFDEQGGSYLSQLDVPSEDDDFEDAPIVHSETEKHSKPKVQVLNVRDKKSSHEDVKRLDKEQIKDEVKKVKQEFQKVEEVVDEAKEEISKLSEKITEDAKVIKAKITEVSLRTLENVVTGAKDFIFGLFFKKKKTKDEKKQVKTPKAKAIPKIKYGTLLAKKVEFVTHDKKSMVEGYSGTVLEEMFMANVLSDVRYCVKYVNDLPPASQGIYANRPISEIFENVTSEDINRFLYYVNGSPEPFIGNNYKFSEAFATWIIRKSHEL